LLLYTVVSLLQKVEEAFNAIWHVTEVRSFGQRLSRYLSVLLVGPILVFAAMGLTALAVESAVGRELLAIPPFGALAGVLGTLVPYLLVVAAFAFIYRFVPNARVPLLPALGGALVGGILWQSAGWAFAAFIATSTQYAAIYSSFAILVLFLIWLYLSWLVLLVGADVSFYLAHPEHLFALPGEPRLSNRMRERLALAVMYEVGRRFLLGDAPATVQALTRQLAVPTYMVRIVLDALVGAGFLARSADEPPAFLPARALDGVPVAEVLGIVRSAGEERFFGPAALPLEPSVEAMMARIEQAMHDASAGTSIEALVRTGASSGTFPSGRTPT
jgi:membrane protein